MLGLKDSIWEEDLDEWFQITPYKINFKSVKITQRMVQNESDGF